MCLDVVDNSIEIREVKGEVYYYGWKVFCRDDDGRLCGELFGAKSYRVNRWLKEEDYREYGDERKKTLFTEDTYKRYQIGFHIFLTREMARRWKDYDGIIRKVKFRNVVAKGIQNIAQVVVAKEMLIIGNSRG